jgi:hypothetical protein
MLSFAIFLEFILNPCCFYFLSAVTAYRHNSAAGYAAADDYGGEFGRLLKDLFVFSLLCANNYHFFTLDNQWNLTKLLGTATQHMSNEHGNKHRIDS